MLLTLCALFKPDILERRRDIHRIPAIRRAIEIKDLSLLSVPDEIVQLEIAMQQPILLRTRGKRLEPCQPRCHDLRYSSFLRRQRAQRVANLVAPAWTG